MKTTTIMTAIAALLVSGGIAAAHPGGMSGLDANDDGNVTRAEVSAKLNERFAKLDADADGKVTDAELAAAREQRRADRFARLDADGDGAISRSEMEAAHGRYDESRGEQRGKPDGDRMRGRLDTNGDGVITKADFEERAFARFDALDANGDGTITEQERTEAKENRSRK